MLKLPPLSLYIHIPWCIRKCPYCDFNSHEKSGDLPIDAYVQALYEDLQNDISFAQGRSIHSIFFGGGTPSLMPAEAIGTIINNVRSLIPIDRDAEITLETNPGTAEYSNFNKLLHAGINRLSFGAQSFDDLQLATLGRIHSSDDIYSAIHKARKDGFSNFNIDLMHGLPGQTVDGALDDLRKAIKLQPKHISWYQLTIEPNTSFYSAPPILPYDNLLADIFIEGRNLLAEAGFEAYETSAYAQPGYVSRHNQNYWRFGDYLAIGAGAHGKITQRAAQVNTQRASQGLDQARAQEPPLGDSHTIFRYQKTRMPNDYIQPKRSRTAKQANIDASDLALEFLMNALRLDAGVESKLFTERTGRDLTEIQHQLSSLRERGLLTSNLQRIQTTARGRLFLNDILGEFVNT